MIIAVRIEPIPLTMAMRIEPMVWQILCSWTMLARASYGREGEAYTRDDCTHCDGLLGVDNVFFRV